jgi:hypothetical protein
MGRSIDLAPIVVRIILWNPVSATVASPITTTIQGLAGLLRWGDNLRRRKESQSICVICRAKAANVLYLYATQSQNIEYGVLV